MVYEDYLCMFSYIVPVVQKRKENERQSFVKHLISNI